VGRAVSLAEELLKNYEHVIESATLIPSDGGRFEVSVNGQLIYSKLETKRHAEPGEILKLISKMAD
jgi:selenoprotein W-related protein